MIVKFEHPTMGNYYVYATLDGCHMAKFARNALGDLRIIRSPDEENISWDYFVEVHNLQQTEGLNLANRLNSDHNAWKRHKMKVRLAVQTFSSSVADAMEFLQCEYPKFQNCSSTIEFIRNIDRLFDFLNSRYPFGRGFKSPI